MGSPVKHSPHPDGRVERWREHRLERRRQLVDATLVALEEYGPEASLSQIAQVAGIPKPKIYRHFDDKADLVGAVGQRLRDLALERLAAELRPDATVRQHVSRSLTAVLTLVAEHPNCVKMLMNAPPPPGRPNAITEGGRAIARVLVTFTAEDFSRAALPTDGIEPLTHALVGSVLGATDWWLLQPEGERLPLERLVDQLTVVLIGAGDAALRTIGLSLDPDAVVGAEHLVRLAQGAL
ncbi:MAG TPA: TetR/AcrR family transcriptional regulator [Nocardioidaceae bacterium]|nr:TetR/AcrR family transcriptional regulator [Nocardioidaceae bacterium]